MHAADSPHPPIGWREWLALPDLGVDAIKVKVDTGARSSALHAYHIERFEKDGDPWVRFGIHPFQRNEDIEIESEAALLEERWVRSSAGQRQRRPVVVTRVRWCDETWPIELTLTNRDVMGFRMLLGREAVRGRHLVDPGRSYYGPRPPRAVRKLNRPRRSKGGRTT